MSHLLRYKVAPGNLNSDLNLGFIHLIAFSLLRAKNIKAWEVETGIDFNCLNRFTGEKVLLT